MKFTVAGSRIICSRIDKTVETGANYRRVVEFDANVSKVPPHVAARLTRSEVSQLADFLADRQKIQANSAERNMLEALPGLLREAAGILHSSASVDASMYQQLEESMKDLRLGLENVRPEAKTGVTDISGMRDSEAQKERLKNIMRCD